MSEHDPPTSSPNPASLGNQPSQQGPLPISTQELKRFIDEHFPGLWDDLEACLAAIATLCLKDNANPTALVLVGPPSSRKTTALSLLYGVKDLVYISDHFTPRAFLSHYANASDKTITKIDLLPRVVRKTLVIPDLGPLFSRRREDLMEQMSLLTRVLDGEGLSTDSGVKGQRVYRGPDGSGDCLFTLLGGAVPFDFRVWQVMSQLGSRLLFRQVQEPETNTGKLVSNLKARLPYKERRALCRRAVANCLEHHWAQWGGFRGVTWDVGSISDELLTIIADLAKLVTRLRGTIQVWKDHEGNFQNTSPLIEGPERVIAVLTNLARGRALVWGRRLLLKDDLPMLVEIAFSSCPEDRRKVFKALLGHGGQLKTSEVMNALDCSDKVAIRVMDTLKALKVVEEGFPEPDGVGHPERAFVLHQDLTWLMNGNVPGIKVENLTLIIEDDSCEGNEGEASH